MWRLSQKLLPIINRPRLGAHAGLFILGDQGFHYNATTAPNHKPRQ
jgi:hypothetical protein